MIWKRDKCSKGEQYCETGNGISTTSIVLAVVIPVAVVAIGILFFVWRAWKRNKKEALDDNDPDFYGENTVLPDYPLKEDLYSNKDTTENPFDGTTSRSPNRGIDEKDRSFSKTGSFYNTSQLSLGTGNILGTPRAPLESFVIPRVDDSTSKHSLDQLSRQLGGVYPGYKVPEDVRHSSQNISRRSSVSQDSKPLTGYAKSTDDLGKKLPVETSEKSFETPHESSTMLSHPVNTASPPTSSAAGEAEDSEVDEDKFYEASVSDRKFSYENNKDNRYSFDNFDNESVVHQQQEEEEDKHNLYGAQADEPEEEEEYEPVAESSVHPATSISRSMRNPHELDDGEVPDLNEVLGDERVPISQEEEEQINRMKSVYKVYFSRENSLKSKKSNNNLQFENQDMPPLPALPKHEDETSYEEPYETGNYEESENARAARPQLALDTSMNDPRASYASSIYLENGNASAPAQQQGHPFYPHQHIQNILNHQQSQAHYYRQLAAQQRRPQQPAVQMENLPSPHELNNRKSTLETFTQFEKQRKYMGKKGQSPAVMQQNFSPIENTQWGPSQTSPSHPSPHQIRDSIVMFNPVDINYKKTYKPSGSLAEQVRKASPNSQGYSPTVSRYNIDEPLTNPIRRIGSESLIPRSGSQSDLRKYVDNANF
ncbi:hypothetical protein OGAPHI_006920 [Ogataea philodendri]|uniref:Uncharacterized protein n=1 Tax=Ogataea philodendri TaxID=1378263 RepID=A0A9P8SZQ3_9ASCO|nr:uncharacterized protein OGAPHI_006920 [Ogataea philodendri]KAH3660334.1 hypothetical protein OGAPHI_006920 [Ogataea philodendri]